MSQRMKATPKWINPCGPTNVERDISNPNISDAELLSSIETQANIALTQAKTLGELFAEKTFDMSFAQVHKVFDYQLEMWHNMKLPKLLGQKLPKEVLDTLKVDETLLEAYGFLQMIAVGLEQIVWDQIDRDGPLLQQFELAENNLRLLLCEIQMAIIERGIKMRADIDRDFMKTEERTLSITESQKRDWKIFREYVTVLEYICFAFSELKKSKQ